MYECMGCGRLFDEPREYREYRGECFGFPAYEAMTGCPFCGGGYMEYAAEGSPAKAAAERSLRGVSGADGEETACG